MPNSADTRCSCAWRWCLGHFTTVPMLSAGHSTVREDQKLWLPIIFGACRSSIALKFALLSGGAEVILGGVMRHMTCMA